MPVVYLISRTSSKNELAVGVETQTVDLCSVSIYCVTGFGCVAGSSVPSDGELRRVRDSRDITYLLGNNLKKWAILTWLICSPAMSWQLIQGVPWPMPIVWTGFGPSKTRSPLGGNGNIPRPSRISGKTTKRNEICCPHSQNQKRDYVTCHYQSLASWVSGRQPLSQIGIRGANARKHLPPLLCGQ